MPIRMSLLIALTLSMFGCGGGNTVIVDDPYESCDPNTDVCSQGTACLGTTLPASAGFTGSLCTVTCAVDTDCPQDITNFAAICVNDQCYTQCPNGGANCPFGTACITFSDQDGNPIDICTP
jgi:hypothetical protein